MLLAVGRTLVGEGTGEAVAAGVGVTLSDLKDGDVAPDLGKEAEDPGLGGLSNSGTPPFGRLLLFDNTGSGTVVDA